MAATTKFKLATELEIRESIADIRAALADGPILHNIWGFFSPKNEQLFTLLGDVTFMQAVLLEGDPEVSSYSVQVESDADENQAYGRILVVQKLDGTVEWLFCCRNASVAKQGKSKFLPQLEKERARAATVGACFVVSTERDLASRMTEFWNWLALSTAMTRARDFSQENEFQILSSYMKKQKSCSFHRAIGMSGVDPALMIAVIAKQLAFGQLKCDLKNQPLNISTEFRLNDDYSCADIPRATTKAWESVYQSAKMLQRNRRTAFVPEMWRDLALWPAPSIENLANPDAYRRNKKAVEMYLANRDFAAIRQQTGLGEDWVRELAIHCVKPHHDGRIRGFRALVRYSRHENYTRSAPVPSSNIHEGVKGGYAGAMTQLFQKFPELLSLIEAHVLATSKSFRENPLTARVRWIDLKDEAHRFLKAKGVSALNYPFNTRDQGYATIAEIARSLLFKRPLKFIKSRYGPDTARLAEMRRDEPSLILPTASFQILEADFHKHDSATTVEIETPIGGTVDAPVPRFWIGCAVDTYQRAILAASDSFETQTTESCVLDLIDAAISPPEPIEDLKKRSGCEDGCWQPNQILPSLSWHAWDIIKLDRAWAHKSTSVLSKLISTVGCAVCFGRSRAWWARAIVERTFRELTAKGSQRLSTTYGTGPGDQNRQKPEETAVNVRLRRSEICNLAKSIVREINCTDKEGNFWEAPLDVLKRSDSHSKYFPRPLPIPRQTDRPTLWATVTEKVEAYPKHGVPPSVRVHRCRYYGDELGSAWSLVGELVVLEISRSDIQIARAINPRTGDIIGAIKPEKRWRDIHLSWQNFLMLQKFGRIKRDHNKPESATNTFISDRERKLFGKSEKNPSEAKKAASEIDKLKANINGNTTQQNEASDSYEHQSGVARDLKSGTLEEKESSLNLAALLGPAPEIKSFSR